MENKLNEKEMNEIEIMNAILSIDMAYDTLMKYSTQFLSENITREDCDNIKYKLDRIDSLCDCVKDKIYDRQTRENEEAWTRVWGR